MDYSLEAMTVTNSCSSYPPGAQRPGERQSPDSQIRTWLGRFRVLGSQEAGTWDSPVGKPRGKASWESLDGSHRSLDPREGKRDTAATAREESARA